MKSRLVAWIIATCAGTCTGSSAYALPIIYGTQNGHAINGVGVDNLPAIFKYDVGTNTLTTLDNPLLAASAGQMIESLVLDSQERFIYTNQTQGTLRRFDPNTGTDTLLAYSLGTPRDVIMEPGGQSVLVSETSTGFITRVELTGGFSKTLVGVYGGGGDGPQGLAYVGHRLFANLGNRQLFNGSTLQEIDPMTGALLPNASGAFWGLDGLVHDPLSGLLFSTSVKTNAIYGFNPNSLASPFITLGCAGLYQPDGLMSDGAGHLFIASYENSPPAGHLFQYSFATDSCAVLRDVTGITDLEGATSSSFAISQETFATVPEPASLLMLASGLFGISALRKRQRARSRPVS